MPISPTVLVRRSRIGVCLLVPGACAVMAGQALGVWPDSHPHLVMMVFLALVAAASVAGVGYIAGRCMICAADAFGAGYRHASRVEQPTRADGPPRLVVVE